LLVMEYLMESDGYRHASHARLALRNAFGKDYVRGIQCRRRRYWIDETSSRPFEQ